MRESWRLGLAIFLLAPTATGPATVSASIGALCQITTSTLALGSYDPIVANNTTALNANGNAISVACTRGATGITIGLGNGNNSAFATGTTRAMASGSNYLSYELYTSSSYLTVWNSSNTVSYTPTSMAATAFTVYATIPAGQDVPVASYSDSVTATVNF